MPKEVKKRTHAASAGPSSLKPKKPVVAESEEVKALRKLFKQSTPDAIATTLTNSFKSASPEQLETLRSPWTKYVQSGNHENACVIECDGDTDFDYDYHNGCEGYYTTTCCGVKYEEGDEPDGPCLSTWHTTNPHQVSYKDGDGDDEEEGLDLEGSRMIVTCRVNGCKPARKPTRK
ncbi:hypothetical protein BDV93DRAFT_561499 [Ceratobasidium sp. AG-I]|nr:hypothetical protein BDV93DRAFT_561499 [Ceratobasidium sp. AG-I]